MRLVFLLVAAAILECTAAAQQIVCYYPNWAIYRRGDAQYGPGDIDPALCTQIVYAFAVLDSGTLLMRSHDPQADLEDNGGRGSYKKVTGLKKGNPNLKVLLAIGGWTDSHEGNKYSRMVANPGSRAKFISNAKEYIKKYNFDGLDLDWEYPAEGDKANFATFVKELTSAFHADKLLVTAAVAAGGWQTGISYDIPSLSRDLDQVNLMAYDYHGSWETNVNHHSPLYSNDQLNADTTVNLWLKNGAPASKLFLGMPMYGKGWMLANPGQSGIGSAGRGPSSKGPHTGEDGSLAYYEICTKGWTVVQDPSGKMGPYAHGEGQWVGYDDPAMLKKKSEYVKSKGLGGAMIWDLSQDDFNGKFCKQGRYPLLTAIKSTLIGGGGSPGGGTGGGSGGGTGGGTGTGGGSGGGTGGGTGGGSGGGSGKVSCTAADGFFKHPTDCTKYIRCVGGTPTVNVCPPGLQYNPECTCCDWPKGRC